MKKIIVALVCAAMLHERVQAQVRIAPKAGLTFSKFAGAAEKNILYTGYYIGTMMQVDAGRYVKIQPEVMFAGAGAKLDHDGIKSDLHYLQIPLLVNYTCKHGLMAVTGPQFGLLLEARTKDGSDKADAKDAFKSSDFTWVFGIGYKTSFNVGIDARYNLGLSDITSNDGQKVRNSIIQAGLFYIF